MSTESNGRGCLSVIAPTSFCGALGLLFIALKLTGVIAWEWVWVLAPLWVPLTLSAVVGVLILFGVAVVFLGALVVSSLDTGKRNR